MPQIVVIEPDEKQAQDFREILLDIDSGMDVLEFKTPQEFMEVYKNSAEGEKSEENKEGDEEEEVKRLDFEALALIVADVDVTHMIKFELWAKILSSLNAKKEDETPLRLLLTGFGDGDNELDPQPYTDPSVFNLLFKPFDRLLTKSQVQIAMAEDGPVQVDGLFQQETNTEIELIKEIDILALTELGFRTKSSRPIDLHKKARYYGAPFGKEPRNSVFAYCYANNEAGSDGYNCSFCFMGVPKDQLASIRREIRENKSAEMTALPNSQEGSETEVLLISADQEIINSAKSLLDEKFEQHKLFTYPSLGEFMNAIPLDMRGALEKGETALEDGEYVLEFSEDLKKLVSFTDAKESPLPEIFEKPISEVDESFLPSLTDPEDQEKWKSLLSFSQAMPFPLKMNFNDEEIFLELLELNEKKVEVVVEVEPEEGEEESEEKEEKEPQKEIIKTHLLKFKRLSERELHEKKGEVDLPKKLSLVLVDSKSLRPERLATLKSLIQCLDKDLNPICVLLSGKPIADYDDLEKVRAFDDVFTLPLDPFFFVRKLKMLEPQFSLKNESDDGNRLIVESQTKIKTAQTIPLTAVSEVHISFDYPREIAIGSLRRFVLWLPDTKEMPEILAVCRHTENAEGGLFRCDFMFFGVQDRHLKYIRKWIKLNYARSKQAEGSG